MYSTPSIVTQGQQAHLPSQFGRPLGDSGYSPIGDDALRALGEEFGHRKGEHVLEMGLTLSILTAVLLSVSVPLLNVKLLLLEFSNVVVA